MTRALQAVGFDGNAYRTGERVALHPATDLWMRGDRYGTVTVLSPTHATVRTDHGRRFRSVHSNFKVVL